MSFKPRAASLAGTPRVIRTPSFGLPGCCITRSNTTRGSASPCALGDVLVDDQERAVAELAGLGLDGRAGGPGSRRLLVAA